MTVAMHDTHFEPGVALEWSDDIHHNENFAKYVALVGKGPFTDFEVTAISPKPPVYGDERFRDGMKVPEKLIDADARTHEARQIGSTQRIKIHVIDPQGHHVSAEFPAHFFKRAG